MPAFRRLPLICGAIAIAIVSSLATLTIHPANASSAGFGPLRAVGTCADPNANPISPPTVADVRFVNVLSVGGCTLPGGKRGLHLVAFYQE